VQNLAEIGRIVLKLCEFNVTWVWLENAYWRPFEGDFGVTLGKRKLFAFYPSQTKRLLHIFAGTSALRQSLWVLACGVVSPHGIHVTFCFNLQCSEIRSFDTPWFSHLWSCYIAMISTAVIITFYLSNNLSFKLIYLLFIFELQLINSFDW